MHHWHDCMSLGLRYIIHNTNMVWKLSFSCKWASFKLQRKNLQIDFYFISKPQPIHWPILIGTFSSWKMSPAFCQSLSLINSSLFNSEPPKYLLCECLLKAVNALGTNSTGISKVWNNLTVSSSKYLSQDRHPMEHLATFPKKLFSWGSTLKKVLNQDLHFVSLTMSSIPSNPIPSHWTLKPHERSSAPLS